VGRGDNFSCHTVRAEISIEIRARVLVEESPRFGRAIDEDLERGGNDACDTLSATRSSIVVRRTGIHLYLNATRVYRSRIQSTRALLSERRKRISRTRLSRIPKLRLRTIRIVAFVAFRPPKSLPLLPPWGSTSTSERTGVREVSSASFFLGRVNFVDDRGTRDEGSLGN